MRFMNRINALSPEHGHAQFQVNYLTPYSEAGGLSSGEARRRKNNMRRFNIGAFLEHFPFLADAEQRFIEVVKKGNIPARGATYKVQRIDFAFLGKVPQQKTFSANGGNDGKIKSIYFYDDDSNFLGATMPQLEMDGTSGFFITNGESVGEALSSFSERVAYVVELDCTWCTYRNEQPEWNVTVHKVPKRWPLSAWVACQREIAATRLNYRVDEIDNVRA